MPLYEYKYIDTGEVVTKLQSIKDEPLKEIDGRKVVRIPSVVNSRFTGSGFYETDYKNKD
jgi:predicted nucleic acid-binding Zn ribbon protein